ncbi:extended synaptotagmin-3 [Triplophysa dalaica]|uniref:extended synaptotagmin-3 n=1 Tax=Triplophysa dalaica TaxID=1582913 RepID=UPI0024DFE506|nr:extended synaptotagmin-3 [Triplophysa dalaica]
MSAAVSEGQAPSSTGEGFSSSDLNQMLMEFMMFMVRALAVSYPVYLTGSFGLSVSWILLSMLMWTMWKKNRKWKDQRLDTAIDFLENEKDVIKTELKAMDMPAWIHFADVEKAAWINKILQQAWPFFGMYMEKLLIENIQPSVKASSPHLKTFAFTKVHMGQKAPTVTGVRVYTHELGTREVILDLNILYEADVDIDAEVKPAIKVGVKGLQLQGMLRVILEPMIGQSPIVGGVTMFFIRRPTLQVNWTGMANILDSPAFSHLSESAIVDIIASLMVLPNRMCIPLIDQVKVDQMRFPLPRGVVRVHVLEAKNLVAKDTHMMGLVKGKSDPYTVLRVGNKQFKTKTIKETLNPCWNEVYEFVIHEAPGQELEVEVYDEDTDADDFLGRYSLDCGEVKREKELDEWLTLEDVESGDLHLKMQWLSLHTNQELLKETYDGLACAMLSVYLDSGSNLPKDEREFTHNEKHGKPAKETRLTRKTNEPNSYVEFTIDKQCQKSKVVYASKDPVYEECFVFFVHNVNRQVLNVEVKENEKKNSLGQLTLPLVRLLHISDMMLDQRFKLERSGANSQIKIKAVLRILTQEKLEPKVVTPTLQTQPTASSSQIHSQHPTSSQSIQNGQKEKMPASSVPLSRTQTVPVQPSPANDLQAEYQEHRPSTLAFTEGRLSEPYTPGLMRRYDSHSLLSENSIASSRFDLSDNVRYPEAIMNHQGSFGQIDLTLRYASLRKRLIVIVNSCMDLFACSESGSDTYVRMYLLPDQTWKHRKRTKVKKKSVNPDFSEMFEFSVSLEEARSRKLDVAVKNNRMLHKRERKEIGMVLIDLSEIDLTKGSTQWYELTLPGLKKTN